MQRCDTCAHFDRTHDTIRNGVRLHACNRIPHHDGSKTVHAEGGAFAADTESYCAWLYVTASFGCALHEPASASETAPTTAAAAPAG